MTSGLPSVIRQEPFRGAPVYRIPPARDFRSRALEWWLYDLPPMHGLLRFVVYAGLFLLAANYPTSPFNGITSYEGTSPELFRSYGLIGLMGIPYIAPEILWLVVIGTQVAWVLAAIGLFSRASAIVTAAGVAFLHGMLLGSTAFNHNYFVTMYTLVALCFTRTTDCWSVDYHLKKWSGGPVQERGDTLADTGLARKALLVLIVGFYFAAGMSKLLNAGPGWADGHTIAYFAVERGMGRPLAGVLAENLWLCTVLATGTLILELGAPAALFSRRARYGLIVGWISMHIGIRYSMGPRYWENILCFALLIDWGAAARAVRERVKLRGAGGGWGTPTNRTLEIPGPRAARGVAAASLLLPLVAVVACFQVFWWPLTNVYMYSSYFSLQHDVRADHPRADYHDAAAAQRIARGYLASRRPIEAMEHFSFLATLRLAGGEAEPYTFAEEVPGVSSHKQWILTVVRPALIDDLAVKPPGRIEFDPDRPDHPAQRLLVGYLPVFLRHVDSRLLKGYERLELTYPLEEGRVAIAVVELGSE